MRNLSVLIDKARKESENIDFSSTRGISDDTFIEWANNAQDRLQQLIIGVHSDLFAKEQLITVVFQQEFYNFPSDIYQGTAVINIDFSRSGQPREFYPLEKRTLKERASGQYGTPSRYIPRAKGFLLALIPNTGVIRVNYYAKIPRLDKRRANVSAVVLGTNTITSLTVDASVLDSDDAQYILDNGFACVVDSYGNQQMTAIPVTAIDLTTGIVTVDPTFTFPAGQTIAVGNYLVAGDNATTHCTLPDNCEYYLTRTMTVLAGMKDDSTEFSDWKEEREKIEEAIISGFAEQNQDTAYVPLTDTDYLDQE